MNNLIKLAFIGEKISTDITFLTREDQNKKNIYKELVRGLIKDTYFQCRNGRNHPIVYELPTTPKKMINWLKQPIKNLIGGPLKKEDVYVELREQPILFENLEFNPIFFDVIEEYIDLETIIDEKYHSDPIKLKLLVEIWKVKSPLQKQILKDDYEKFRTFLSKKENNITTITVLESLNFKSELSELFTEVLLEMYEDLPQGEFNYCEYCGWTLKKGSIGCIHKRCKEKNEDRKKNLKQIYAKSSHKRLKRGVVRSVLIPGMFELELFNKIKNRASIFYPESEINLYPEIELMGDISIKNTLDNHTTYIDCKDYQITDKLIKEVEKYIENNHFGERIFVYPSKNHLSKNKIRSKNKEMKQCDKNIQILSDEELLTLLEEGAI